MFKGLGCAFDEGCRIDAKHRSAVAQQDILAHPDADGDDDAQFLFTLANQCFFLSFTRLDFATRKLPLPGHFSRLGPLARQNAAVFDDRRSDDDANF